MSSPLEPPVLSYEQINQTAEGFLREYHAEDTLPIPIEEIAEFDIGIDIVPFPNLQRDFDVDGFMAGDMSCIYVDEFVFMNRPTRYRFTLAHEIGHIILHKAIISGIRPISVAEWEDFIENVDQDAYEWLEYQAYAFAGLILVPRGHLLKDATHQIDSLRGKIEKAKLAQLPRDSYIEYVVEAVATRLVKTYDVSIEVLRKRITKEIEKDNIIIP